MTIDLRFGENATTTNHEERTTLAATRTVTTRAAVFQEIKEDDVQLRALLARVCQLCKIHSAAWIRPRRFAMLLTELRDQIPMHLALDDLAG